MISYVSGDLFQSPVQTLVNTVNTDGVMGKGIALRFKRIYPEMFKAYQKHCESGGLDIGRFHLYRTSNKLILNFPTKTTWRKPSRPEYIEAGLKRFVESYDEAGIDSIAFPPIGCGNGELDFKTLVQPMMEHYLGPLSIPVMIYPPLDSEEAPEHKSLKEIKKWLRSEPRSLAFSEMWSDLRERIAVQSEYATFRTRKAYKVEWVEDDAIRLYVNEKTKVFHKEQVRELWQELRDRRFVTKRSLAERERDVSYLLPIIASLPYVEVVEIADTYSRLASSPTMALQLVPPSRASADQLDLIALA